jgi:hypothetical protein
VTLAVAASTGCVCRRRLQQLILENCGQLDASGCGVGGRARCGHVLSLRGLILSMDLAWDGSMEFSVPAALQVSEQSRVLHDCTQLRLPKTPHRSEI